MAEPTQTSTSDLEALRLDKSAFGGKRARRRPWVPAAVVVGIVLVAAAVYLTKRGRGPAVETVLVPPPARPDGEIRLTATGYVVARRKAAVGAKIPGRLAYLGVEEGSQVRQGDVIARLESSDLEANVHQERSRVLAARADLEEARAQLVEIEREAIRQQRLLDSGVGTQAALETAQATAEAGRRRIESLRSRIAAAEAALDYARAVLDNAVVRAPFDGVVLTKDADIGESVAPAVGGGGTTRGSMVTMADMGSLEVEADVSESNIAQVVPGQPAEIVLDAFPDRVYPASVHQIVPTADRQRATVQVKVRFAGETQGALPEMSAKVNFLDPSLTATATPRHVISIPALAFRGSGADGSVFTVEQGQVREVRVTLLAPPRGGRAEVVSGLTGGEEIVAALPRDLASGSRVRVKQGR